MNFNAGRWVSIEEELPDTSREVFLLSYDGYTVKIGSLRRRIKKEYGKVLPDNTWCVYDNVMWKYYYRDLDECPYWADIPEYPKEVLP